ncbi:MAG TPA: HNH endonuclease signature motif containing protein, partial [Jatrophihabitans sp.]
TFPGCDTPPDWCQRHHIIPWWQGGPTDLNNLTLVCGHHHREFQTIGWTCVMTDGPPYWIPPPWIDPHQKPQHNRLDWKQLLGKADAPAAVPDG